MHCTSRQRPLDRLSVTGDFTYTTRAEFVDTGTPIPLAPIWTARADITVRLPWDFSSSFEMDLEAFLSIENLTDVQWREAQFAFTPGAPRSLLGASPSTSSHPEAADRD